MKILLFILLMLVFVFYMVFGATKICKHIEREKRRGNI